MTNYLLVHGSWHGAWCWFKITARLRAAGHNVHAPDLPGCGRQHGAARMIGMGRMVRHLAAFLPEGARTVIVVHSRYGVLASALSEAFPQRIERVIYLASYMLGNGHRAADCFRADRDSLLRRHVDVSAVGLWDDLRPEIYREGLYHDCSAQDVALASSLLCREPLRPALHRLKLSVARYGQVPRAYIRLTEDMAVSLAAQDRCIDEIGADRVASIQASHSAYFSQPDALVSAILSLSRQ